GWSSVPYPVPGVFGVSVRVGVSVTELGRDVGRTKYRPCETKWGGVYLDGDTLKFNPFANVLDDAHFDMSAERIRDQMSVMASPNGNLDEVHEGLLLQAVQAAWLSKRN
ncbi:conjugal transfer ATP-binding protein TraC, partial [Klebsiella pneumoniae subsp. pneumoniae KPNIH23]